MSHMRAGLAGGVAGTEQVVLQMTAEEATRKLNFKNFLSQKCHVFP